MKTALILVFALASLKLVFCIDGTMSWNMRVQGTNKAICTNGACTIKPKQTVIIMVIWNNTGSGIKDPLINLLDPNVIFMGGIFPYHLCPPVEDQTVCVSTEPCDWTLQPGTYKFDLPALTSRDLPNNLTELEGDLYMEAGLPDDPKLSVTVKK